MESGDKPLPQCEDVAAVFQDAVVKHLLQKTQRALLYCQHTLPQVKHLVSQLCSVSVMSVYILILFKL